MSDFKGNCFSLIDIFGINFNFLVEGEKRLKTKIGASLTLVYIIIVVALFFGFGVDLYLRKNPKVSYNTETMPYKIFKLSNENFTYAYRIEDENGEIFLNESIAYPLVYYGHSKIVNGSWVPQGISILPSQRCTSLPNVSEKESYFNISLKSWFCINFQNISMGGNWDGNFVSFLQINIQQCNNSTRNNSCASKEHMEESFKHPRSSGNLFYSDLSLYINPSLTNYENPYKTSLINNYYLLSLEMTKRKVFTFKQTMINNDVGWFFEDVKKTSVISTDQVFPDLTLKEKWTQDIVYSSFLYIGNKIDTYNRSYTKIQEVIASVGGFAKFFYTCIFLFYTSISSFYQNYFLIENFPFNEDEFMQLHENAKIEIKNLPLKILELKKDPNKNSENLMNSRISYYEYFISNYCCIKMSHNLKFKKYQLYNSYFDKNLDIFSFLKLQNKFKHFSKLFLTKAQKRILEMIKPKLKDKTNFEDKNEKTIKILNEYMTNQSNYDIGNTGQNILSLLDSTTKLMLNQHAKFKNNNNNISIHLN